MKQQRLKRKFLGATVVIAGLVGVGAWHRNAAATATSPDDAPLNLTAKLSERELYLNDSTGVVLAYPIAIGSPAHPTPTGRYLIRKIVWNPRWIPPDAEWARRETPKDPGSPANPMKVVKIFYREPDYYIHGTGDTLSLGANESHGCLRMHPEDVAEVARYIMLHGGQPRDESWFWRVLHFRREEKPVYLNRPIPLTITE